MLDAFLILIIATTIFTGWRRGGMVACLSLISTIVSIFIVYVTRNPVTDLFMKTGLPKWIEKHIVGKRITFPAIPYLNTTAIHTSATNAAVRVIVMIIAMLVVFIVLRVIFEILIRVFNGVLDFISLGSLNHVVGAVLAVVPAYITVYLLSLLVIALSPMAGWIQKLKEGSQLLPLIPSPFQLFHMLGL